MTVWTNDRTDLLRKLWADGLSASQIACELGDISRNSVMGKVHRLGLSGRRQENSDLRQNRVRNMRGSSPRKPKPSRITAALFAGYRPGRQLPAPREEPAVTPSTDQAAVTLVPEQPARCTIMDLTSTTCRWPIGDSCSPDFFYCGQKTVTGLSYCGYHAGLAYRPAESRRRGAA